MTAPIGPSTSLNGFWERARRLLQLFGQQWDSRITPVLIVGDSREPAGMPDSYRRFSLGTQSSLALGGTWKLRCDAEHGAVITNISWWWDQPAAQSGNLRTMDEAQAVAGAPVYSPIVVAAYMDRPSSGKPPFSEATTGTANSGNIMWPFPRYAGGFLGGDCGIFLPKNTGLNFESPTAALTNFAVKLDGYLR